MRVFDGLGMKRAAVLLVLASFFLAAAAPARPMAFNKHNVYVYFRQVNEKKQELPRTLVGREREVEVCRIYVSVLAKSGYDFNATVAEAVSKINDLNKTMDNPRFSFLAGTFQTHPDVYFAEGYLTQKNRDDLVKLFSMTQ